MLTAALTTARDADLAAALISQELPSRVDAVTALRSWLLSGASPG